MIKPVTWRSTVEFQGTARAELAVACNAALCARLRLFAELVGGVL